MKLIKVVLNDVPEDCITEVKRLAAVAVDRFYSKLNETIPIEAIEASNTIKDAFREANGMIKKYNPDVKE